MAQRIAERIVRAPGGIERIDAQFAGAAFSPHRHDAYAIGITLAGVQCFDYRGITRGSRPGGLVILHPDELHDGRAGDDNGFRYRTAYVAPAAIQGLLGEAPLPFVEGGVSADAGLRGAVWALLGDLERPLAPLEQEDGLFDLVAALMRVSGAAATARIVNREAANRARDYIEASLRRGVSLADLESATGHDRWQLSRDFRALFGTSPYRYLTMRRLDAARAMMLAGESSAGAAFSCGFADQSHFNRLFKRAYGQTPGRWRRTVATAHDRSIARGRAGLEASNADVQAPATTHSLRL